MVHRRWVPYCHPPLLSDPLHPEDGPSQGPHELPANPIHSSYGRLALGTAFTAGYKLPSARAITRSIASIDSCSRFHNASRATRGLVLVHSNLSIAWRTPPVGLCLTSGNPLPAYGRYAVSVIVWTVMDRVTARELVNLYPAVKAVPRAKLP